tara:strand:- start:496 stop:840 length:345 start_codon:yes stop_codon:yes gene_type:complete
LSAANRSKPNDPLVAQVDSGVCVLFNVAHVLVRPEALKHGDDVDAMIRSAGSQLKNGKYCPVLMLFDGQPGPFQHERFAHPVLRGRPIEATNPLAVLSHRFDVLSRWCLPASEH